MKKLIVANWKMNPESLTLARKTLQTLLKHTRVVGRVSLVVCPPSIYISDLKRNFAKRKIAFGIQNISDKKGGAYTGEVSALMAKDAGATYSIIGHSERRESGETDDMVSFKIKNALSAGLVPILCVGEKERDHDGRYLEFLSKSIKNSLFGISKKDIGKIVIAYEPVWAIGKNSNGAMEPREIHETVLYLRKILSDICGKSEAMNIRFIYGGSVEAGNAPAIMKDGDVSGILLGRASLDPSQFIKIIESAT